MRRTRDDKPGKYFYSTTDDYGQDGQRQLPWMFFNAQHEKLFIAESL